MSCKVAVSRAASTEPLNCFSGEAIPMRVQASERLRFNGAAELLQRRGCPLSPVRILCHGFNGAAELLQRRESFVPSRGLRPLPASTEPLNCFSGEIAICEWGLSPDTRFNGAAELLQRRVSFAATIASDSSKRFNGAAELLQRRDPRSSLVGAAKKGFNGAAELLQRRGGRCLISTVPRRPASTEPLNCFSGEDGDHDRSQRDRRLQRSR